MPRAKRTRGRPRRTHCSRGHALVAGNLHITTSRGKPQRACLTCYRASRRARTAGAHAIAWEQEKQSAPASRLGFTDTGRA
jgi:hypothetical protein